MRIAIVESSITSDELPLVPEGLHLRIDDSTHGADTITEFNRTAHDQVCSLLSQEEIDGVEIFIVPYTPMGFRWMIENDIQICNMSLNDWLNMQVDFMLDLERELAENTLLITSAGNTANEGESPASLRETWMAIGAIDQFNKPRHFSSWGKGKVFGVAQDGYDGHYGTSFAAPRFAGLMRYYYMVVKKYFGYWPDPKSAIRWAKENCHDVWDDGWDLNTGWGKLKLPKRWELKESIFSLSHDTTRYERKMVDGVVTQKEVPNLMPFKIENNRSYLNPRDVSDSLNVTTHWDGSSAHFMV